MSDQTTFDQTTFAAIEQVREALHALDTYQRYPTRDKGLDGLAALQALAEAADAMYERVQMDESVGICLSTRAECLTLGDALARVRSGAREGQR